MDVTVTNVIFMATGMIVTVVNLLIIFIFSSSKSLLTKFQLCIVLAVADMVAGVGTVWTGLGRYIRSKTPENVNSTSQMECLFTPWLPLTTIGSQLPALTILLIGCERIMALFMPIYYLVKFHTKQRLLLYIGMTVF